MNESHWSTQKERAAGYWNMRMMLLIFRLLPVTFMRLIAFPLGFFYFLFSKAAREFSRSYLNRIDELRRELDQVWTDKKRPRKKRLSSLSHFISFALSLVDKVEAWGGKALHNRISYCNDDTGDLIARLESGQGAVLISSHLGNMEFIRALAGLNRTGLSGGITVNAIVDLKVTANFNRMLNELNPQSAMRLINVSDMGPDTMILLAQRLCAGELIVIAGDRTGSNSGSRNLSLPFLGAQAPFPYGPFLLAALLNAPIYAVFALRQKEFSLNSGFLLHIHKSSLSFDCSRSEREARIMELVSWFVSYLQQYCQKHPYQWYNFFNFWKEPAV